MVGIDSVIKGICHVPFAAIGPNESRRWVNEVITLYEILQLL